MQYHGADILNKKEESKIKRTYLEIEIGQHVYLVYKSKRAGGDENIILVCKLDHAVVNENGITYTCKPVKVINKKEKCTKWGNYFSFKNSNIDTGCADLRYRYPVFTTKEKCIQWLKGN